MLDADVIAQDGLVSAHVFDRLKARARVLSVAGPLRVSTLEVRLGMLLGSVEMQRGMREQPLLPQDTRSSNDPSR